MRIRLPIPPTVAICAAVIGATASCGFEKVPGSEPCFFDDDASPGVQGFLRQESGDGATGTPGAQIALSVSLFGLGGNPLCNQTITWSAGPNSGTVTPTQGMTNESGLATATWTLGPTAGSQTVTATVDAAIPALSVTFTGTAVSGDGHPKAEISVYNGTSTSGVTVTMQTPFDGKRTFGPLGPNAQASDSLQVEPDVTFAITAVVGSQSASVTCKTLPEIVPQPGEPATGNALAAIFSDGGLILNCDGAWKRAPAASRAR